MSNFFGQYEPIFVGTRDYKQKAMVSPSFSSPAVMSLTALTDRPISIVPTAKLYRLSEQSVASANDAVGYRHSSGLSRNGIPEN